MGCLLALLLRWPLTLVPGALPLDPNSALHVLGAWDLGAWDLGVVGRDLLLAGLGDIVGLTAARH